MERWSISVMYRLDTKTGDTIFMLKRSNAAREVFLVGQCDQTTCRVPMHVEDGYWTARLPLPAGLFIYRFEVDGRSRWDRAGGKLKAADGHTCSLAVISGGMRN